MVHDSKAMCLTLWFPKHNNLWYEAQFSKLGSMLKVYKFTLSNNRILRGAQYRVWRALKRRVIYPVVLRYLSHRHETLFTVDVDQISAWPKPNSVVIDIDDALFSPQEIAQLNLPQIKKIIVITDRAKALFQQLGVVRPIQVIPKGVLLEQIKAAEVKRIQTEFKSNNDIVIGYPAPTLTLSADGMRRARQGMDDLELLFASAEKAREKEPAIKLWLIGEASDSVKNYVAGKEWITLVGYVPSSDILNYVSNFDVGVYPRAAHVPPGRISVKIAQYMACGVPIVSTRVDEASIIQESGSGFVCSSQEDFSRALVELAQSAEKRKALGIAGRNYAKANFDWSVLVPIYEEVLIG
jgi:glycosyltransferase involved in cell wall biosynthesis